MSYAVKHRRFVGAVSLVLALFLCLQTLVPTSASVSVPISRFADCPETHPYYPAISTLADMGVVSGTNGTRVAPDRAITKAEYMALLVRLFYPGEVSTLPADPWYLPYQNFLLERGVFQKKDFLWINSKITWEFLYASALWAAELYPYPAPLFSNMPEVNSDSNLVVISVYTLVDAGVISTPKELKAAPTRGETMDFLYRLCCTEYDGPESLSVFGLNENNFEIVDLQKRWGIRNTFYEALSLIPQKYIDYFLSTGWDIVIDEIDVRAPAFKGSTGLFCGSDNTIYIDGTEVRITLHEFGHFLWWFLDLTGYANRMFADAQECEGLVHLTGNKYCLTDSSEFFAEAFAMVLQLHQTENGQAMLEQYIPKSYAAIRYGLLEAGSLVDYPVWDAYFPRV